MLPSPPGLGGLVVVVVVDIPNIEDLKSDATLVLVPTLIDPIASDRGDPQTKILDEETLGVTESEPLFVVS